MLKWLGSWETCVFNKPKAPVAHVDSDEGDKSTPSRAAFPMMKGSKEKVKESSNDDQEQDQHTDPNHKGDPYCRPDKKVRDYAMRWACNLQVLKSADQLMLWCAASIGR